MQPALSDAGQLYLQNCSSLLQLVMVVLKELPCLFLHSLYILAVFGVPWSTLGCLWCRLFSHLFFHFWLLIYGEME